jgi:hypothetical protein
LPPGRIAWLAHRIETTEIALLWKHTRETPSDSLPSLEMALCFGGAPVLLASDYANDRVHEVRIEGL